MKQLALMLVGTALLGSTLPALADTRFQGGVKDQNLMVPVTLDIASSRVPGEAAGRIRFGGPWQCGFTLEFAGSHEQRDTYSTRGAGAGRCTQLTSGFLDSRPDGKGGIEIQLFDRSGRQLFTSTLTPADK